MSHGDHGKVSRELETRVIDYETWIHTYLSHTNITTPSFNDPPSTLSFKSVEFIKTIFFCHLTSLLQGKASNVSLDELTQRYSYKDKEPTKLSCQNCQINFLSIYVPIVVPKIKPIRRKTKGYFR